MMNDLSESLLSKIQKRRFRLLGAVINIISSLGLLFWIFFVWEMSQLSTYLNIWISVFNFMLLANISLTAISEFKTRKSKGITRLYYFLVCIFFLWVGIGSFWYYTDLECRVSSDECSVVYFLLIICYVVFGSLLYVFLSGSILKLMFRGSLISEY